MKTWVSLVLIGLVTSVDVNRCWAQDVPAIPPGEDKIVVLKEGERSPFSGQLFDPPTALRWANWLGQYRLRLKTDVELQQQLRAVQVGYQEQLLAIEREKNAQVLADYVQRFREQQLRITALEKELASPPWYKSPWVALSVGVVGTTAVYILSTK